MLGGFVGDDAGFQLIAIVAEQIRRLIVESGERCISLVELSLNGGDRFTNGFVNVSQSGLQARLRLSSLREYLRAGDEPIRSIQGEVDFGDRLRDITVGTSVESTMRLNGYTIGVLRARLKDEIGTGARRALQTDRRM
tara:strand:+ start:3865 stop:4278 length:414 start_codon:yes stop_codon:yes gene_type:complete